MIANGACNRRAAPTRVRCTLQDIAAWFLDLYNSNRLSASSYKPNINAMPKDTQLVQACNRAKIRHADNITQQVLDVALYIRLG